MNASLLTNPMVSLWSMCIYVWFDVHLWFCIHTWDHFISQGVTNVCGKSYLAQSFQQERNARQSFSSPLVVTVMKHETHQLRISGAHCLLKNCMIKGVREREMESKTLQLSINQSLRSHLTCMNMRNLRSGKTAKTEAWGKIGTTN